MQSGDEAILGHLDAPSEKALIERGPLLVHGWAFGRSSPVARVEVAFNGKPQGRAGLFRYRPDVAQALGDEAAELSGFELRTDTSTIEPTEAYVLVTVTVTLLDGTSSNLNAATIALAPAGAPVLAAPPVRRKSGPVRSIAGRVRLLCFARSLDHGGSQLRMKELVAYLHARGGFHVTVVSPTEGSLRRELEAAGATVRVAPLAAEDAAAYETALSELAAWAAGRFDVVLAFTLTSFAGIDLADRLGLPSVWRIGENVSAGAVSAWLGQNLDRAIASRAERAFETASAVVFVSNSSRTAHQQGEAKKHFSVLVNGVDVSDFRTYGRAHDRRTCREKLGIRGDRRVLICAATLWPIKGQALLVAALKQVLPRHPGLECLIVGQHVEPYADALPRLIAREGLSGAVRLVSFQDDLRPWWRAADVALSPSEHEALSTSVLEAMASGLPVLASRVGGQPEVVEEGVTGWLFEPSDLGELIAGLEKVATAEPRKLRKLGKNALARVAAYHNRAKLLPRMADLLRNAAEGSTEKWLARNAAKPRRFAELWKRWTVRA